MCELIVAGADGPGRPVQRHRTPSESRPTPARRRRVAARARPATAPSAAAYHDFAALGSQLNRRAAIAAAPSPQIASTSRSFGASAALRPE